MPDLIATISGAQAAYYEKLGIKLHKWLDPLTEAQFWRNPFPAPPFASNPARIGPPHTPVVVLTVRIASGSLLTVQRMLTIT